MYFAIAPLVEQRAEHPRDVFAVPDQRYLLAPRVVGHLLERLAADELVVELDERSVAQVVRRQVVVADVVRVEAAAERCHGLVALAVQPLAVRLHVRPGIDRGQGRRDPARIRDSWSGRCARPTRRMPNAWPASTMASRTASPSSQRPKISQPGCPTMPWRSACTVVAGDGDDAHVEELDVRGRLAEDLLHDLQRVRALHLISEEPARALVDGGALVAFGLRFVLAAFDVVLHPVERRRAVRPG